MKSTLQLLVLPGFALGLATKTEHANLETVHPKTAFCMTGNVRENHAKEPSKMLRSRLDMIDPTGMVFAYVNPCEAQTKPWWWDMIHRGKKRFVPKPPVGDCWGGSFWKETIKPAVVKEYRDPDVAPVPRTWCSPGSADFITGVYQQWKGVQECFKLIKEYEEKHFHKFETVVRFRADACKTAGACALVTYCSMATLDKQKAYLHDHNSPDGHHGEYPGYFDNFAILPRQYADVYFNALDTYYQDCTVGGPGEALLIAQMVKHHVPTADKCECHTLCTPGKTVFIERRFLPDLETYEDVPLIEMESQPMSNFGATRQNATRAEFVKPTYMRLKLSPSPSKAQTASQPITNLARARQESATSSEFVKPT